jgi:carbon storage regulator
MLVLRRRVGEAILVGGEVEIEVIEISRSRVKLGVRAPFHVPVIRKETQDVAGQNRLASDLVAGRADQGVVEILQLLNRPALNQPEAELNATADAELNATADAELNATADIELNAIADAELNATADAEKEDGSTKPPGSRYETPERYSGYRGNRENPHPA